MHLGWKTHVGGAAIAAVAVASCGGKDFDTAVADAGRAGAAAEMKESGRGGAEGGTAAPGASGASAGTPGQQTGQGGGSPSGEGGDVDHDGGAQHGSQPDASGGAGDGGTSGETEGGAGLDGGAGNGGASGGTSGTATAGSTELGDPGGQGGISGFLCIEDSECTADAPHCVEGTCAECQPGREACASADILLICTEFGEWEDSGEGFNFNPEHCGECGHGCLGGDCSAGQCQPFELAVGESSPTGLALAGDYVYYAAGRAGLIRRVHKSGEEVPETIASNRDGWPRDVVIANGFLFFTEGDRVYQVPSDGSEQPEVWYNAVRGDDTAWELATDFGQEGIAASAATVMWWDATHVLRGLAAASTVDGEFVELGGPGDPGGVAISRDFFFWSRRGSGLDNGYVQARTRSSSPENAFIATVAHPVALAFDGESLYYASAGQDDRATESATDVVPNTGAVYRSVFNSGTNTWENPELLVGNVASPWDMVVDDRWVYWTSYDAGTVSRVAKTGGEEDVLAKDRNMPFNIEQDAESLYWTESVHPTGSVTRLAK